LWCEKTRKTSFADIVRMAGGGRGGGRGGAGRGAGKAISNQGQKQGQSVAATQAEGQGQASTLRLWVEIFFRKLAWHSRGCSPWFLLVRGMFP
jgi:hypothetical protein